MDADKLLDAEFKGLQKFRAERSRSVNGLSGITEDTYFVTIES